MDAAREILPDLDPIRMTMTKYIHKVAELKTVRWKGLNLVQILSRLDVDEYLVATGQKEEVKKTPRWVPFKDTTRLLHCMFGGEQELIVLFKEMGTSLSRHELDDPAITSKRDIY